MCDFSTSIEDCEEKLSGLWTEIGYTSTEKEQIQKKIEQQIISIFQNLIQSATNEKASLQKDINKSIDNYTNLSKALGKASKIPENQNCSMRQRYNEVNILYNNLYKDSIDVINKFKAIYTEVSNNFSVLGIPNNERGEFASIGNKDLSSMRYQRFVSKNKELLDEINSRDAKLSKLKTKVNQICKEIEEPIPENVQQIFEAISVIDESFSTVNSFLDKVTNEKQKRLEQLTKIGNQIVQMWDLLNISEEETQEFLQSHSTLSLESISFCENELSRLMELRKTQLPVILANQQVMIIEMASFTHSEPQVDVSRDPNHLFTTEEEKERAFNEYNIEIHRLKVLKAQLGPLLDLIAERERILNEYKRLEESIISRTKGHHPGKYISPENPRAIMREDNDFRRLKNMIPRIEKKLKLALLEYRADKGHDLVLDGEPYINQLDHIILSNLEISRSLEGHQKRHGRKSMAPAIKQADFAPPKNEIRRKSENVARASNLLE